MACSDLSFDFSSLSLSEPDIDNLSFGRILNTNGHRDSSVTSYFDSAEDELSDSEDEKYIFEENEKDSLTQTSHKLILREYQKELASNAFKRHNTVICAPTGSGKTPVATYIIQEHLKQSDTVKKVAFLARVQTLADQQYKYLRKYLPSYNITLITGSSSNCMSLHLSIPENDIIVMTPMILENHLKSKLIPHLGIFSMLVFDECHHTRKGEPYNTLMHFYHKTKYEINQAERNGQTMDISLPQIIGLTASIGIEGAEVLSVAVDNIMKVCANLDAINMSTIEDNKNELMEFVAIPTEEKILLQERQDNDSVFKIIEVMRELEKHMERYAADLNYYKLSEAVKSRPDNRKSQKYEQWIKCTMQTAKVVPYDKSEHTIKNMRLIIITAMYLKEYRFALETYDLVELGDVMDYLETSFADLKIHEERITEENTLYTHFLELKEHVLSSHVEENPNLQILSETLIKYLIQKSQDSRCIVFVRTRALATALSKWLNNCSIKELRDLHASSFTGTNVSERRGGTAPSKQESIIERFRRGLVRLIVSTSVAEEGLDIPSCNLVIKYNHVGNEVTTVQSRGRSRAFGGVSILLATKSVLQREFVNQRRAKLMKEAFEGIRKMTSLEFEAVIARNQEEILKEVLLADEAEQTKRKQTKQFEIVCSLCRKVSVESVNLRTIYGKYRISIDGNLLNKIKIRDTKERTMDEILFVGTALCQGEIAPGKRCFQPLGTVIKFKNVHYITIAISKIAFIVDSNQELRQYKQWKKVPFFIDELTFEDTERYINDADLVRKFSATDDDSGDDEDSEDEKVTENDTMDDSTNNMQQNKRNNCTEVKKPF